MARRTLPKRNLLKIPTKANITMNKQKDITKEPSLLSKMNNCFLKLSKNLPLQDHQ